MKKVIRSKSPVTIDAQSGDQKVLYMRISSIHNSVTTELITIMNQYYTLDENGNPVLLKAEPTQRTYQEKDFLVSSILDDDSNKLYSHLEEEAYLKGAIFIIESQGIFGSKSGDWEMVNLPSEIHKTTNFG